MLSLVGKSTGPTSFNNNKDSLRNKILKHKDKFPYDNSFESEYEAIEYLKALGFKRTQLPNRMVNEKKHAEWYWVRDYSKGSGKFIKEVRAIWVHYW